MTFEWSLWRARMNFDMVRTQNKRTVHFLPYDERVLNGCPGCARSQHNIWRDTADRMNVCGDVS